MTLKRNIIAFFIIGIVGTLSHFVYEWSGFNHTLGYVFPVNESIWEHLKLIFFPCVIYFVIEYFTIKEKSNTFLPACFFSIYYGMSLLVIIYYTITGIIGKNIDFLNILYFFIAIISVLCRRRKLYQKNKITILFNAKLSIALIIITCLLFGIWSYNPPMLGIFTPPHNI